MKVKHGQLLAMITSGDERYFYTRVYLENFSHVDIKVHLRDMKAIGVAKTIRSDKKVSAWYDSNEGLEWLQNKINNMEALNV